MSDARSAGAQQLEMPRTLPVLRDDRPSSGPPVFERIAIVGLGLMGGSIALAIRRRWAGGLIIAVDRKDVLEAAMRIHAADVAADDLVVAAEADLVILAAPVRQNLAVLAQLPEHLPGTAVVTDVGSTKVAIAEAARALPDRLTFTGGHPLAGAAVGGLPAARPDLFDGRPWILTPEGETADLSRLEEFVAGLGAAPMRMRPAAHDQLMAYLSHLPQLAVSALMEIVGRHAGREGLALAGRGLRDTTRLAMSPPGIWRDIAATNAAPLGAALDELIDVLQRLRDDLTAGRELERVFNAAADWKRVLESPGPPDS